MLFSRPAISDRSLSTPRNPAHGRTLSVSESGAVHICCRWNQQEQRSRDNRMDVSEQWDSSGLFAFHRRFQHRLPGSVSRQHSDQWLAVIDQITWPAGVHHRICSSMKPLRQVDAFRQGRVHSTTRCRVCRYRPLLAAMLSPASACTQMSAFPPKRAGNWKISAAMPGVQLWPPSGCLSCRTGACCTV
jgi:hypothetical protein